MSIEILKTQVNVEKTKVYTEFKPLLTSAYDWSKVIESEDGNTISFYLTDTLYFELSKVSNSSVLRMRDAFGNAKSVSLSGGNANMILKKCGNALTLGFSDNSIALKTYNNSFDFVVSKINGKPCIICSDNANVNIYSDERNGSTGVLIVYDVNNRYNPIFSTQLANVCDPYQGNGIVDNVYQMLFFSVSEGVRFDLDNVEYVRGTNLVIGGE